jgi:hypothetical protein
MNAILYVLKNGQWQKEGVWEKAVQALARRDREREGRPASPSALVMDSHTLFCCILRP